MEIIDYEKDDELVDKHTSSADFIKEDVMSLADMATKRTGSHQDKIKLFDIVCNVGQSLDEMWDAFSDYRCAYSSLLEKTKTTDAKEES